MKGVVGQLVVLVGGGANAGNGHQAASHRPAAGLKNRLGSLRQTLRRGKAPVSSGPRPEQVIPLEDDNFKDF
jgi:hypothetical protein